MDCRILGVLGLLFLGALAVFLGWCAYKTAGAVRWVHKHYKKEPFEGSTWKDWVAPPKPCNIDHIGTYHLVSMLRDRVEALEAKCAGTKRKS